MRGFVGDDIYRVFNAGDIIVEGVGDGVADRVAAAVDFNLAGDDNIEFLVTDSAAGLSGIDLRGNALAQTLQGNAGANTLNGLGGSDTISGFGGSDTFVFNSALGAANVDIITDYAVATDQILLENAIFTGLGAGVLGAAAFSSSIDGVATDASDRIMYETDTGFLWFDADGNNAGVRVRFADLTGGLAMTAGEFTVV
jgi:Ca2+-binding RTX toxin-like protein